MKTKTTTATTVLQKSLMALTLVTALAMGCSKNSSQSSTLNASEPNSGQSIVPTNGVNPALKVYGNSVVDLTGLLGLGGQMLAVNVDALTQGLDIGLRLPTTLLFLAQTYLLKYPQIQTSITNDANGSSVLHLKISIVDALAAYKKWQQKNPDQVQAPPPINELPEVPNNPATPVVIPAAGFQGRYTGTITPQSNGVFGDGSWPRGDATVLVERPDFRGLGYALGGDFNITVDANGVLGGVLTIWGFAANISAGQIPAGSNEVTFIVPGATGYLKFENDGTVTGYVYEPGPQGDEWETHKRGNISGRKQ